MKKSIYLAALAALVLSACSNDNGEVFDQSAAERLEQYKKEYADVLTSDGGLWSMEYFCNPDEPGYVFVMKFDKNGSVEISANHKWIDNDFKQETSLWKMIADNGPVLSFNSYNNLFHIFSDPANITGPDAPTGEDGDINETGYGHEGDYEFQVMEVSEDSKTVRLLGKKRMYDIFLHRLDPSTDVEAYLADVKAVPSRFSATFNELTMTDSEGNLYRVTDLYSGIPSVYPLAGDAVSQTVTANGIFTLDGFRFMKPFQVKKADDTTFEINRLTFTDEGSMVGDNVSDLRAVSPLECVLRADLAWVIDANSMSGKVKQLYEDANAAIVAALTAKDKLGDIELSYGNDGGVLRYMLITRIGTRLCKDYVEYNLDKDENGVIIPSDCLDFKIIGGNNTASRYDSQIPAYKTLKDYLAGEFVMTVENPLAPSVITVTDKGDSTSSFNLVVK